MKKTNEKVDNSLKDVRELNHGYRVFDFLRFGFISITISTILVVVSIVSMLTKGFELGQDFTGGTTIQISLTKEVSLDLIRKTLEEQGYTQATVQQYQDANTDSHDIVISLPPQAKSEGGQAHIDDTDNMVGKNLTTLFHTQFDANAKVKRIEFVGPTVGQELATHGTLAIIISLIGIMIYIAFRFEWRFGASAVIGLAHDVIITCGYLSLFGRELDLTIIAALLSVIGYSLNDTIVVFDRIRENFRKNDKGTPYDIINVSLTQTLRRTLMTSGTTLIVVVILFFFGGPILRGFSETLFIGIVLGTISSIYVSAYLAYKFGVKRDHFTQEEITPEGADFDMSQFK